MVLAEDTLALLVIGVLSLAAGYRWLGEGRDYSNYLDFYNSLPPTLTLSDQRYETGFVLAAWFFKYIAHTSYQLFATSITAVSLTLKYSLARRLSRQWLLALLVYLLLFYPIHEYTQVRAALSMSLAFFGTNLLFEGKLRGALILFAASLLFHFTGAVIVIAAAVYLLRHQILPIALAMALVGMLLFGLALSSISVETLTKFNPLVTLYVENIQQSDPPNILSAQNIILTASVVAFMLAATREDRRRGMPFLFMTALGLALFVILRDIPVFAHRLKELLAVSVLFWAFNFTWRGLQASPALFLLTAGFVSIRSFAEQGVIFQ